ncbi:hypothetical protein LT679_18555, partial [Mucilaginibacter roseus]
MPLKHNTGKSFQGSIVLGKGFVLTTEQAEALIAKDPRNKEVLFPYLNGDDLNNNPEQKASRWVINFFDWPEDRARTYPDCFEIVERLVRPERQRWLKDKNGYEIVGTYALRKPLPQRWWIYGEKRPALYQTISKLDHVMAINRHAKYLLISIGQKNIVYSEATIVIASDSYSDFSILSSAVHDVWAWKNSSTMGASTLRYSASNAFETFPFPNDPLNRLEKLGYELNVFRRDLMRNAKIGLTETYNRFNDKDLNQSSELYEAILKLRNIHCEIDKAVTEVFNWNDLDLKHDFYEVEFLPESDRVRFTVPPDTRKEILSRLFNLNQKRHADTIDNVEAVAEMKKVKISLENINLFSNQ